MRRSREGTCGHGDMGTRGDDSAQGETGNRIVCWGIIVGPCGHVFPTANR
jgi:hypothetical protein